MSLLAFIFLPVVEKAGIVRIKSGSKPNNALTLKFNIFVTVVQLVHISQVRSEHYVDIHVG